MTYEVKTKDELYYFKHEGTAMITNIEAMSRNFPEYVWTYEMTGLHDGKPIVVNVIDVRPDYDEDGWTYDWVDWD